MQHYIGYLDPGSGSMLLQIVLAGMLGLGFTIKKSWRKILGFFRSPENENDSAMAEVPPSRDKS